VNQMLKGQITSWDTFSGRGLVTSSLGVHPFGLADCSAQLQVLLAGKAIPPDERIAVTFDLSAQGQAVNLTGDPTTEAK
jgi:hypothetical protein